MDGVGFKQKKRKAVDSDSLHKGKNKKQKKLTFKSVRKQQLLEANEDEDKEIKRLEKLLKLKKKKKKKLPSYFQDDGLDYLFDVIDKKEGDILLSDDSLDLQDDLAAVKGASFLSNKKSDTTKSISERPVPQNRTLTQLMKEKGIKMKDDHFSNDVSESEEEASFYSDAETSLNSDAEVSVNSDASNSESAVKLEKRKNKDIKSTKPKIWEDIYGRTRDELGNVVKNKQVNSQVYVPPKKRKEINTPNEKKKEESEKIKRQLKGLLNRLSESNLQNICHQIEDMYMRYSRNDMNETLFSLMTELLFTPVAVPPRLVMEQAMLVALLHANVGSEVGAYYLQHIVEKLGSLFQSPENYSEGKECNNILIFLSHLYNFKVSHSTLIFDVFELLIKSFGNKDIELIQLFLKGIGFVLRKDNPLKLKELILAIQEKAATFNAQQNDSRVKFMLDTLIAIKNNNIYKIPDYDPTIIDHKRKLLRGFIRKGCSIQELAISYEDLLNAEEKGRWWIVGSAWANDDPESKNSKAEKGFKLPKSADSEKFLELAKKQHMNTEVRKSIFCIILAAEDYMDAFEKLLKLNLKNQQKREIIHVILHCALHEKVFNPYYAYLAGKFCKFAREYQMCLQFSLWDKFKDLSSMKPYQVSNLAHFLSLVFISGDLPLSVLKVIHFSEMDKTMVRFFRQILLAILLHESEEVCLQVFKRIAPAQNLKLLRESLRLFMHHFLLRNQTKLTDDVATKLEERVKLAEAALRSSKHKFKL